MNFDHVLYMICNMCYPQNSCCLSTLITHNFVISSAYCVQNCQFITRIFNTYDITKINNYYVKCTKQRKFFSNKNCIGIASIIPFNNYQENEYARLGMLNVRNLFGFEGVIPTIFNNAIKSEKLIIQRCNRNSIDDYNIICGGLECTRKNISQCNLEEGGPIFLDDKVIGIATQPHCYRYQMEFVAIASIIPWIMAIIRGLAVKVKNNVDMDTTMLNNEISKFVVRSISSTPVPIARKLPRLMSTKILKQGKSEIELNSTEFIVQKTTTRNFSTYLTTNAMDWFNKYIRNREKSDKPRYTVTYTSKITKFKTSSSFVDLT